MEVENNTGRGDTQIREIASEASELKTLAQVLEWGARQPAGDVLRQIVSDVIVQDEYSHDVIVPWKDGLVLVYGTT